MPSFLQSVAQLALNVAYQQVQNTWTWCVQMSHAMGIDSTILKGIHLGIFLFLLADYDNDWWAMVVHDWPWWGLVVGDE